MLNLVDRILILIVLLTQILIIFSESEIYWYRAENRDALKVCGQLTELIET